MKDHLRMSKSHSMYAACGSNKRSNTGYSPLTQCYSPKIFNSSKEQCLKCKVIFDQKIASLKKQGLAVRFNGVLI